MQEDLEKLCAEISTWSVARGLGFRETGVMDAVKAFNVPGVEVYKQANKNE